jgi:hypothetical protein
MKRTAIPISPIASLLVLISMLAACQPVTPASIPADFLVILETGACFGTCPVYSLRVAADGSALFDGMQFVEAEGPQRATLPPEQVKELVEAIVKADFFNLRDNYTVAATDLPSITTTVTMQGRTKSVYHYGVGCGTQMEDAPRQLCTVEALLQRIAASKGWVLDN